MKGVVFVLVGLVGTACGKTPAQGPAPAEKPGSRLPVRFLGGASIPVFPLNNMVVQPGVGWDVHLASRRDAMRQVDSILLAGVQALGPEVKWISQARVRRAAEQAPAMLTNPDQLASAQLKRPAQQSIPEPLRAQLRQLTGIAAGGRYALVPAELVFGPDANQQGYADFTIVLADVRVGEISWSNTMRGTGPTPWEAVALAVRTMFP